MNLSDMARQIEDNDRKIAQLLSLQKIHDRADSNAGDYAAIQSRADSALSPHGKRAGAPMLGEPLAVYRKRLGGEVAKCSPRWADLPLEGIRDDAFQNLEQQIYADCAAAPPRVGPGELRAIPKTGFGGHRIVEYVGSPDAWMGPLGGSVRQFVKAFNTDRV
jgi:hypothetical protein